MSDVNLQGLFASKKREFKVLGSSLDRFELDFIDAVNRSINRINIAANLSTEISRVSGVTDTVTGLAEAYEHVLSDLVTYNMIKQGQRIKDGVSPTEEELADAIDSIRQDILNDSQAADTDDDTSSNVGLGVLE